MHNWYTDDGWHYKSDPFGIIPIGFEEPILGGKVLGFCSPAGLKVKKLMAVVTRGKSSYTTMKYMDVLMAYFKTVGF